MRPILARTRTLAARACSLRTMERLVDPVLADINVECEQAMRQHGTWRARWVLLTGVAALCKAFAVNECYAVVTTIFGRNAPDDDGLRKVFWSTNLAVVALTVVLQLPVLYRYISDLDRSFLPFAMLTLMPAALTLTVPMGVTAGVFYGLRECRATPRALVAIVLAAIFCSMVMFATVGRLLPAANQAFRVAVFGAAPYPAKGLNELTLRELREKLATHPDVGGSTTGPLAFAFHQRIALATSTFFLALFALAVNRRRRSSLTRATCTALATDFLFYAFLVLSNWAYRPGQPGLSFELAPVMAAWFPNLVFFILAIVCFWKGNKENPIGSLHTA